MQNTGESEDLRVRRTRKMLQQALIDLTVEKGFNTITVRDITERAMVNRSTFYRHYLDKYDLLNQYMDEVYELIANAPPTPPNPDPNAPELPNGLMALLRHIQSFADFYRVMLGSKGDAVFIQRFRQNIEKRFRFLLANAGVKQDPNNAPIEMRLSFISCADIGAILWWLENDQPCSLAQLAIWLGKLSSASAGFNLRPMGRDTQTQT